MTLSDYLKQPTSANKASEACIVCDTQWPKIVQWAQENNIEWNDRPVQQHDASFVFRNGHYNYFLLLQDTTSMNWHLYRSTSGDALVKIRERMTEEQQRVDNHNHHSMARILNFKTLIPEFRTNIQTMDF